MIQGAVSVFIHETSFIITTGGMFLVPRGPCCRPFFRWFPKITVDARKYVLHREHRGQGCKAVLHTSSYVVIRRYAGTAYGSVSTSFLTPESYFRGCFSERCTQGMTVITFCKVTSHYLMCLVLPSCVCVVASAQQFSRHVWLILLTS